MAIDSSGHLTRGEALVFKMRWAVVNGAEREDLATAPMAHQLRQLGVLLAVIEPAQVSDGTKG